MDHATLQAFADDYADHVVEITNGYYAHHVRAISATLASHNREILRNMPMFPRSVEDIDARLAQQMDGYEAAISAAKMKIGLSPAADMIDYKTDVPSTLARMRAGHAETSMYQMAVMQDIHKGSGKLRDSTIAGLTMMRETFKIKTRRLRDEQYLSEIPSDLLFLPFHACLAVRDAYVWKAAVSHMQADCDGDLDASLNPEPSAKRLDALCAYVQGKEAELSYLCRLTSPPIGSTPEM